MPVTSDVELREILGLERVAVVGCSGTPGKDAHEVPDIVDAALERDDVKVVWTQLGIRDGDAAARAEAAGKRVVQDRCMRVEHQRLVG